MQACLITMAKRSDIKETVLLALELLRRIPRNSKISAPELHQQLAIASIFPSVRPARMGFHPSLTARLTMSSAVYPLAP
jgi:hypothetical protein